LAQFERSQLDPGRWIDVNLANGRVHAFFGENQPARENYETALAELEGMEEADESHLAHLRACYAMGELLTQQAPQEALDWFQRGRAAIVDGTNHYEQAALYIGAGTVRMFLEQYEQAKTDLQAGLDLLGSDSSQLRVTAIENLGVISAEYLGDLEKAVDLTKQALSISEELNDQFKIVELLSTLGTYKHAANDWPGAMADFEQALLLAQDLGNEKVQAMVEANLGYALTLSVDYDAALAHLTEGLELSLKTQQQIGACQVMLDMAYVYLRREEWPQASLRLDQSKRLAHDIEAEFLLPQISRTQAELERGIGDLEAALASAQDSLEMARASDNPLEIGLSLQVWGKILASSGRFSAAERAFQESVALLQDIDLLGATRSRAAWGISLVQDGHPEKGLALIGDARAIFGDLGASGDLISVDNQLKG
jgi:tetratricopeptide (TPR) repeat protein